MATVSQTLEGAGHRLKKTLRSRVDRLLDRHSGQVGRDLSEFIQNFSARLGPAGAADSHAGLPPGPLSAVSRHSPRRWPTTSPMRPTSTWWNSSGSRKEWLRQEMARLWQPLFLTLQESLALYYREIADLGLAAAAPTLEPPAWPGPRAWRCPSWVWRRPPTGGLPGRCGWPPAWGSWAGPGTPSSAA